MVDPPRHVYPRVIEEPTERVIIRRRTLGAVLYDWEWDPGHIMVAILLLALPFLVFLLFFWIAAGLFNVHLRLPVIPGFRAEYATADIQPASATSAPITWPQDFNQACAQQYGSDASAQLDPSTTPDIPSYWVQCFRSGERLNSGSLDLDRWCQENVGSNYHSFNPIRLAPSSASPWLNWSCQLQNLPYPGVLRGIKYSQIISGRPWATHN